MAREHEPGYGATQRQAGKKIVIVDDDTKIVQLVKLYLVNDGYTVYAGHDGEAALQLAREQKPDLVVLDLMLPKIDGLDVCRTLREESGVLIVMLTARATEQDILIGLDAGADDYIVKPFRPRELAARIRAVLRRLPDDSMLRGPARVCHGELELDFARHEVTVEGRPVRLTAAEFKLLGTMVREPERVFTRAQLVERVFGYDYEGFERSIDVHILKLRAKLEPDRSRPRYVRTVYGVGYKFATGEEP